MDAARPRGRRGSRGTLQSVDSLPAVCFAAAAAGSGRAVGLLQMEGPGDTTVTALNQSLALWAGCSISCSLSAGARRAADQTPGARWQLPLRDPPCSKPMK